MDLKLLYVFKEADRKINHNLMEVSLNCVGMFGCYMNPRTMINIIEHENNVVIGFGNHTALKIFEEILQKDYGDILVKYKRALLSNKIMLNNKVITQPVNIKLP